MNATRLISVMIVLVQTAPWLRTPQWAIIPMQGWSRLDKHVDPKLPKAPRALLSGRSISSSYGNRGEKWQRSLPPPDELSDASLLERRPTSTMKRNPTTGNLEFAVLDGAVPEAHKWKTGASWYKPPVLVNDDPDWEAYTEEEKKVRLVEQMKEREEKRRIEEVRLMSEAEVEDTGGAYQSDDESLPGGKDMLEWLDKKQRKYRYVALVYFTGTWDKWCRDYLVAVERDLLPHIRKAGGNVYGITAQRHGLAETRAELGLSYRLVTDQSLLLAQKYRVQKCKRSESPYETKYPNEYPNGYHQSGVLIRSKNHVYYHWFLANRKLDKAQEKYFGKMNWPLYPDFVATIWAPDLATYPRTAGPANIMHLRSMAHARDLNACRRTPYDTAQLAARPPPAEIWQVVRQQMAIQSSLLSRGLDEKTREALCVKRLMRDLKECLLDPLPMVVGRPVFENDIREWHCNILGTRGTIYSGVTLHLIMNFPVDYPLVAPKVRLGTSIAHPNSYGNRICLDMLADFMPYPGQGKDIQYSGWTSAYSVQSILIQLQAFLMDGAFTYYKIRAEDYPDKWWQQWHNNWLASTVHAARTHICKWCGHTGGTPYPAYPSAKKLSKPKAALIQFRSYAASGTALAKEKQKMIMSVPKKRNGEHKGGIPVAVASPIVGDNDDSDGEEDNPEGVLRPRPIVERKSSGDSDGSVDELDGEGYVQVEGEGENEGKSDERSEGQSQAELAAEIEASLKEFEMVQAEEDAFWANKRAEQKRIADEKARDEKVKARAEKKQAKKAGVTGAMEPGGVAKWSPPKWTHAQEQRCKGHEFKGIVTKVENYGAFVDVGWKKPGLVYIAELGEPGRVDKVQDVLKVGDHVVCRVLQLDHTAGKLALTMKECRRITREKRAEEKTLLAAATANLAATKAAKLAAATAAADARATSLAAAFEVKAKDDALRAKKAAAMAEYAASLSLAADEPLESKKDLNANGGNIVSPFNVEANREAKRKERADAKELKRAAKAAGIMDDGRGEGEGEPIEDEPGVMARARSSGVQLDLWGRKSPRDLAVDQLVLGVVKDLHYMGAFIDIGCGKDGLLHILTMQKAYKPRHIWEAQDVLKKGQKIVCRITQINFVPPQDDEQDETVLIRLDIVLTPADIADNKKRGYKSDSNVGATVDESVIKKRERLAFRRGAIRHCPPDILRRVMSYLDVVSLKCIYASCDAMHRIVDEAVGTYWTKQELICFHSKQTFEDDTLGLPLTVEYYDNGEVAYIHPQLDLLSKTSFFVEKVRLSVWKQEFTHWLPLYLNKRHSRNLVYHERAIALLCNPKGNRAAPKFNPLQVLKVLPSLLNTMVVNVMNGNTYASTLSLAGYTSYYQLLLAFMAKYPELQASADRRVKRFLKSEIYRKKRHCPSLGEWLIIVSVSSFRWEEVAQYYLKENFDRNVKWVCEKHPELVNVQYMRPVVEIDPTTEAILQKYQVYEPEKFGDRCKSLRQKAEEKLEKERTRVQSFDSGRLPKTFTATIVSIRLLLFHVYFLRTFRPADSTGAVIPLPQAMSRLSVYMGRPSQALIENFQAEIKTIRTVRSWSQLFWRLGLPSPRDDYLIDWLQTSVKNSARKKYHDVNKFSLAELSKKEARLKRIEEQRRRVEAMWNDGRTQADDDADDAQDAIEDALAKRGGKNTRYQW